MKGKETMRRISMMDSGFSQYLLMLILKLRASYDAYSRVKRRRMKLMMLLMIWRARLLPVECRVG